MKELNSTSMRPHPHLISTPQISVFCLSAKVTTYLASNLPSPRRIQALFASPLTSASYFLRANPLAQPIQNKMQVIAGRKLLTCRYWAFGPRCPNIDATGVDTCDYAHWDTGNLSNFYQQRGTCWYWANPKFECWWGIACSFEHRETGYMGVHHGSKLA
jgi:hypothetical protein